MHVLTDKKRVGMCVLLRRGIQFFFFFLPPFFFLNYHLFMLNFRLSFPYQTCLCNIENENWWVTPDRELEFAGFRAKKGGWESGIFPGKGRLSGLGHSLGPKREHSRRLVSLCVVDNILTLNAFSSCTPISPSATVFLKTRFTRSLDSRLSFIPTIHPSTISFNPFPSIHI